MPGVALPTFPCCLRATGVLNALQQLCQRQTERMGQPSQGVQSRIPTSALDTADVGPVKLGPFGELFLRQAHALSQCPQLPAEGDSEVGHNSVS